MNQRLLRTLNVGLDDERQRLGFAFTHIAKEIGEVRRMLLGELHVAVFALTEERNFAGLAFVRERDHFVARLRHTGETLNFDRDRGTSGLLSFAKFVQHGTHAAKLGADKHHIAAVQHAGLHKDRSDRTAPLVKTRFNHQTSSRTFVGRLEFKHFGLQQHILEQLVHTLARLG